MDVARRSPAEVFAGKLGEPGKEKDLLTAPRGLAVAKGLLYVADPAADRVVAFKESDRSYAGEIAVKNPQVDRRRSRPAAPSTSAPTPARRRPT